MSTGDDIVVGDLSQLPSENRVEALQNVPGMNYGAWRSQVVADAARTLSQGAVLGSPCCEGLENQTRR